MMTNKEISIYIHIPFCDGKCYYCNFCSGKFEKYKDKYFEFLINEIQSKSLEFKDCSIKSVYLGGGTPSSVETLYIQNIANTLKNNYNILYDCEFTIEANPCSVTEDKLIKYKELGINRISFGVQSLDDNLLSLVGRRHTANQAISAIRLAKKCGFTNISADLLIGIPNQIKTQLSNSLKKLVALDITHISTYMLMIEDDTKIKQMYDSKKYDFPSDDDCVDMYNDTLNYLEKNGFHRYEISNFSKSKFESKHNLNYWELGEYIGFGISAHSFLNNRRIANASTFKEYFSFKKDIENISKDEAVEEYIMLGLRTSRGIDCELLKSRYDYDILLTKKNEINELARLGCIDCLDNKIVINKDHFGVSNQIILKLI